LIHEAPVDALLDIIYEDDSVLVVNKPAGLVCHPTKGDALSSLISRMRLHLGENARPQLVNRLDRETSGVIVAAKNPEAARELRQLWEGRQTRKEYLAIVHGHVVNDAGVIDAPLGRDESSPVAIKDCVRPDGAPCRSEYAVLERFNRIIHDADAGQPAGSGCDAGRLRPFTLLRVIPHTGRKHQIRIHLAWLGHPIVGDKIYGGDERLYLDFVFGRLTEQQKRRLILPHQALHAACLKFTWRGREWQFESRPEPWFEDFYRTGSTAAQ